MNEKLLRDFQSPGPEYRGKPFWSWNGKLEKDELLRQIQVMKDMGCGGHFMHSRTGLITEYLGDEWFDLINACADESERLGMEAWLYDEDRWPSGSAGGKVTKDPKYRMKYMRLTAVPANEFTWSDGLIAAFTCNLDGIDYSDCKRIAADTPRDAYSGDTVLQFTTEEMACSSTYNGETYLDTLQKEATEEFINVTHKAYKERCGDRLGKSIQGIFTDEPHRGIVMCSFGNNDAAEYTVPWTESLFDDFQKRFGYDLVDHLPAIYFRPDGKRISQVKWHYMEHVQQMFLDNWAKPLDDWCRSNKLIQTGHVLHEDSLVAQSVPQGSMMRYYEHLEYPGVDVLTEHNRAFWIVKQLASVARQMGHEWLLSELYGCTGWQMSFESHKAVGDWQALFGINLRCQHLSWYTMQAEAKRDFPGSILHQSAWYKEYEYLETYFSRIHAAMHPGAPVCDVLVVNPVESVWAQIHSGWAPNIAASSCPNITKLEQAYKQTFHWLAGAQIDFDYGDEDHIKRFAHVETTDGVALLHLGQAAYRVVVVSGMETIRTQTLDVLEQFIEAGGRVVVLGDAPAHVDAIESDRPAQLATTATQVPFDASALVQACEAAIRPSAKVVEAATGTALDSVFCQVREDGEDRIVLAMNVDREKWFRGVTVRIYGQGVVEEWDCLTGERCVVASEQKDGYVEFLTDFPPVGEHLYVLTPERDEALPQQVLCSETARAACDGPYEYSLEEPNICVLDRAKWRVDDGEWEQDMEILQIDRALRRRLGLDLRGGLMLQPWFSKDQPHEVKGDLELAFEFHVEKMPTGSTELIIETPDIFDISVNDKPFSAADVQGWWVDNAFQRIPLPTGTLVDGLNTVTLRVPFHENIDLESLYLIGDFGVALDGTQRTLVDLPERVTVGDLVPQGLPFYTGKITYKIDLPEASADADRVFVETSEFEAACILAKTDGVAPKMIGWLPYEADVTEGADSGKLELEVILTRRNTFGPLHQVPLIVTGYGPGNFTTEGPAFSENYMLFPSGLLRSPEIVWKKAN